jgi:TRAP transporter TAXI family solute receptor
MHPRPCLGRAVLALLAVSVLAGCARGPDEAALRQQVQERLSKQVKDGLLEVVTLRRTGSAPLGAGDTGRQRVVVYFNATLRFRDDYDFGGWEKLSPASLGYALGATEKGLVGIKPQNRAGETVHVYGSSTYEWSGDTWQRVAAAPSGVTARPDPDNTAPPSRSKQLIDRLAAMVDLPPPGPDPGQEAVIAEELDRATENIQRRLARRRHVFTFASGPSGGEYARFVAALLESAKKTRPDLAVRHVETEGSVENAWLLARGEADYAIIQGDVAAEAVAGRGPFEGRGPVTTLRALGSLFPEAVHVVVPADSPIRAVEDLRGKRVGIGAPDSGTRHSAVAVLAAHGIRLPDLREVREDGQQEATRRLLARQLDALFVTIAAPARGLQELAARRQVKLVPLSERAVERLVGERPGVVPMTLPANTYPGQGQPVPTVATAALLVVTADAPETEVERLLSFVFARADLAAAGSAEAIKVSKRNALVGITIPVHPGASRFFAPARS